jgi:hypothetical protein
VSGPLSSLPEVVDAFARQLGIVAWHFEPEPRMPGYWLVVRFECETCCQRWTVRVESGSRDEVIRDLYAEHDKHRCDLKLGPAGRW